MYMDERALLLAGISEQIFHQRGNNEDNNDPDGDLHAVVQ
jgi:hypothetical protein